MDSNQIAHHYHEKHSKYVLTWSEYFHYGIFEDESETLESAQKRTLDVIAEMAGIDSRTRLLDVGSGLGSTCLYLSEKCGCKATGIDPVISQVEEANVHK